MSRSVARKMGIKEGLRAFFVEVYDDSYGTLPDA